MAALISFFAILFLSLTVVRIATVMLRLTGLSKDIAQFQARSAFTTTGFTAQESEIIMAHPVRRRIIQTLMVLGNVGFVSFVSSLILTLLSENAALDLPLRLGLLVGGSFLLFVLTRLPFFDALIGWIVRRVFRNNRRLYRKDYDSLLFVAKDYEVVKVGVREGSWMADRTLHALALADEGVLVIGIDHDDGSFEGSPRGDSVVAAGDRVTLYGRESVLAQLAERPRGEPGDEEHRKNAAERRSRDREPDDLRGSRRAGRRSLLQRLARPFRRGRN